MSAGSFTVTRYAASYGDGDQIHPIRVQPETIAASIGGTANNPPSGSQNNPIQCRVGGGRRSIGLRARSVTLRAPISDPPDGYRPGGITKIPALAEAFYDAAVKGASCSYLGSTFTVVSRSRERVDGTDGG
jgi:hypothetical protein